MKIAAALVLTLIALVSSAPAMAQNAESAQADKPLNASGKCRDQAECEKKPGPVRRPFVPYHPPESVLPPRAPAAGSIPPSPPPAAVTLPPLQPAPRPQAPAAINNCIGGACVDAAGNRYGGGTGNVYLDGSGRSCRRDGNWLQCN
jgi:hypothetical protein